MKYVAFLLLAIFLVSAGYSFSARIQPYGDAQAYDRIGWNLARGLGYIEHEKNASNIRADDAIFRVGPGYEFFLAGIYLVFGHHAEAVWIIHAFLRALTAWFLYRIALLLFSEMSAPKTAKKIGLTAAAIFGFFPDLILMNGFLLYETLLLFFGVAAVYFSLRCIVSNDEGFRNPIFANSLSLKFASRILHAHTWDLKNRVPPLNLHHSTLRILLASFFWALAILTRPSELLPFLVFPIALIFTPPQAGQTTKKMRYIALSFIFPILLVGGWSLRNSLLYDQPLFTTTAGAYALWVGNNAKASGGYDRPHALQEARDRYHSTELSRVSIKNTIAFIKHHPLKFFELQFKKTIIYFSLIRPTGFWPHLQYEPLRRLLVIGASLVATAFLFIASAAGAWLLWTKKNYLVIALYGFMLAKPLAVIPFYVETRYRYSLYPLLALASAFFLIQIVTSPHRAAFIKMMAGVFATFLIIASIDAWLSIDIIINKLPDIFSFL